MPSTSLIFNEYIADIPWEESPAFILSDNTSESINAIKNMLEIIPVKDSKISFNDNVWDFNPYIKYANCASYKFIFKTLDRELNNYCKFFILYKMSTKVKISTINVRYSQFVSIISNIYKKTHHKTFYIITTDDIINEITERNVSHSTTHNLYQAIFQVYDFLIKQYKLNLSVNLETIYNESIKYKNLDKKESNKLPDIPYSYFDIILNKSIEVMRNTNENSNYRIMAAALIFISQTGLRLGDFLALTTDCLFTKELKKSGNIANYIHFKERKASKAHQPLLEFNIFCNIIATEAFNTMKSLRKYSDLAEGNNILFALTGHHKSSQELPHTRPRFNAKYQSFMYNYLPKESTIEWEGISKSIYNIHYIDETGDKSSSINLYIPDTRQYRVHLSTTLYNKGVPLVYIQKYMGHLSDYMLGYYVRPKDTYQENIEYSEKVVREIAEDNLTPLGGNLIGGDIKENIKQFIADNGFNVHTDISSIVKALGDKVIIRGKNGGVCIKTSIMPCSKDARTNEMMCAYNICPNLFHFYYMIDITYLNFKTLEETYKVLIESGKEKAAQKELAKIKDVINRKLIPELNELDKEILNKGADTVLTKYPSLIEIIENRENIEKEINIWKMKK